MSDQQWADELFSGRIPENAVITDGIAIVGYLTERDPDDEGDTGMRYGYHTSSDSPMSMLFGLMEMVKMDMHFVVVEGDEQ